MNLVIFDCDGTLVDSQHAIFAAMEHAFGYVGLPAPSHADVIRIIGLSVPEAIAALAPGQSMSAQAALGRHFKSAFPHIKEEIAHRDPLFPGIKSVVEALAARDDMALGIATGKSRRGMVRLFDQESWHPHFVTVQTADDHPSKPHPSMIVTAMADAGVAAGNTIMIGDTTFDMVMGLNAGVGTLGVGWGYHDTSELRRAGADGIVEDAGDLLVAIDRLLTARRPA